MKHYKHLIIFPFVGRLIRSRQFAHLFRLPVYVARLPPAPFCETPSSHRRKIALILTFSLREKELPLPLLSHWERRTRSASEGIGVGIGEGWGEGSPTFATASSSLPL